MKLRLQSNSLRLRLKRGEVAQLADSGRVEERIVFAPGPGGTLRYILETSDQIEALAATLGDNTVLVRVPRATARRWASGNEVGLEAAQAAEGETSLRILIEKDFACLNGTTEQNADTFPNPLAGTKC